jgi:hypothetical protein
MDSNDEILAQGRVITPMDGSPAGALMFAAPE